MVPGMTERERLAADLRRLDWLADATLGPARIGRPLMAPPSPSTMRPLLPVGLWRGGLSSARVLGQRFRLLSPAPGAPPVPRAPAPAR